MLNCIPHTTPINRAPSFGEIYISYKEGADRQTIGGILFRNQCQEITIPNDIYQIERIRMARGAERLICATGKDDKHEQQIAQEINDKARENGVFVGNSYAYMEVKAWVRNHIKTEQAHQAGHAQQAGKQPSASTGANKPPWEKTKGELLDFFQGLGLGNRNSTYDEVHTFYKKLARQYILDKSADAETRFQDLNTHWQALGPLLDPSKARNRGETTYYR